MTIELDDEAIWRNLALQFDGHRMEAMALLRYVSDGLVEAELPRFAKEVGVFLAKPPLPGDQVLADRIRTLSSTKSEKVAALHFVFTHFPGPGHDPRSICEFVEVETPDGKSVNAGEWRKRDDGLVELVVPALASEPANG